MPPRKRLDTSLLDRTMAAIAPSGNPLGEVDERGWPVVPLATLEPNPDQPRKGPLPNVVELAQSIREYGLLQPIVTRPTVGGKRQIIFGHRRAAAYEWLLDNDEEGQRSRWAAIPYIDRDTPAADRLVVALAENMARESLTEADIVAGLMVLRDAKGWSQSEIARRLGVTQPWISMYFRVAADPEVGTAVQLGAVSAAKGYEVVRARDEPARRAALEAAQRGATLQIIRRTARHGPSVTDTPAASAHADPTARDLADVAKAQGHRTRVLPQGQLFRLIRNLIEKGALDVDTGDYIKALRGELRRAEAGVRSSI